MNLHPKFNVGDLVVQVSIPEAGFPIADDRPSLIIAVNENHVEIKIRDNSYSVLRPNGKIDTVAEYEISSVKTAAS